MAARRAEVGFTRLDLLGCLLGGIIFVAGVLPAIGSNSGSSSKLMHCLTNQRQLTQAWLLYAEDWDGVLLSSIYSRVGIPEWSGFDELDPENTRDRGGRTLSLDESRESNVNPLLTVTFSPLNAYLGGGSSLFRCPADRSFARHPAYRGGSLQPRVRSYSMNDAIGGQFNSSFTYVMYTNRAQLVRKPSGGLFLFIDEHAGSIRDGSFWVRVPRRAADGTWASPSSTRIIDYPAAWHSQGAGVSFSDGHAEYRRWHDRRTRVSPLASIPLGVPSPTNADVLWLADRATVLRMAP